MKYSIIGDEDTVLGFGIVGVSGRIATNPDEAERAFKAILQEKDTGIIIITIVIILGTMQVISEMEKLLFHVYSKTIYMLFLYGIRAKAIGSMQRY